MKQVIPPKINDMMNPVLQALRNLGGEAKYAEIGAEVARIMALDEFELHILRITRQLSWAVCHLETVGLMEQLVDSSGRGFWALTEKGRQQEIIDPQEILSQARAQGLRDYLQAGAIVDAQRRIQALRDAGQAARADGAQMFLDGALDTRFLEVAAERFRCAICWIEGGERPGDNITALGAKTQFRYEIRDPQGDLVMATDEGGEAGDWILAFVKDKGPAKTREKFGEDAPPHSVRCPDGDIVSIGYIYRVALGG